jgi:hypothetical protein
MSPSMRFAIGFAIALQASAAGAAADPVRVTGGNLSFDTGGPPSFRLLTSTGQLFEAEGFRRDWPAPCFYQCSPGAAIPISLGVTATDDSAFFQGNGIDLFPVMDLAISAPSVTMPEPGTPNGRSEHFLRSFTFTGQLKGYASPDRIGTPVFDLALFGSGTATLSMALENGRYSFSSLDYNFDAAPVPEPATLLLVGTGAALLWRRRRVHP